MVFEALISFYDSARQVEAELSHKVVWKFMRRILKKMFSGDESMRLSSRPMRRHHYLYGRNRYLSNPAVLAGLAKRHRELAAGQARELGTLVQRDFRGLYGRRSDCEPINRGLEDTLYLGRAHSVVHARQHVNLLGYALMVNSLALH